MSLSKSKIINTSVANYDIDQKRVSIVRRLATEDCFVDDLLDLRGNMKRVSDSVNFLVSVEMLGNSSRATEVCDLKFPDTFYLS